MDINNNGFCHKAALQNIHILVMNSGLNLSINTYIANEQVIRNDERQQEKETSLNAWHREDWCSPRQAWVLVLELYHRVITHWPRYEGFNARVGRSLTSPKASKLFTTDNALLSLALSRDWIHTSKTAFSSVKVKLRNG